METDTLGDFGWWGRNAIEGYSKQYFDWQFRVQELILVSYFDLNEKFKVLSVNGQP